MPSARSWFNVTLYKKNLTRFWPVWGLYLVIWLFLFPVALIMDNYSEERFAARDVLSSVQETGLALAVVFSLLAAMAVWSYLYNSRSACLLHTLPIRREGLFITNFLSGMTFLVGPNLVVLVLTLLAEAAVGYVDVGNLAVWFAAVTLMELFFFSFATFCAMFTGHILCLPAFFAILNGLAAGLVGLITMALDRFVYGFALADGLWLPARCLTPVWMFSDSLYVREIMENNVGTGVYQFFGLGCILIYAVAGLILAGLALVTYRRRHMERSGDVVTVAWMRPVFQYGVAFCCALAFGAMLYEIFSGGLPETAWTLLGFMLLCGAVGYFIARMLLEKSFRVFRYWKGCLPFLAVLVVLTCVMELDVLGYERKVPRADQVASVQFYNLNTLPYDSGDHLWMNTEDPQVIQAVLAAHQSFVDNKADIERDGVTPLDARSSGFEVIYTLTGGGRLNRDYAWEIPVFDEDLDVPGSPTALLDALANLPQAVEECYELSGGSADTIIGMTLSDYAAGDEYNGYENVAVSKDAYEMVFEALMADFAEGNIGRRYLMNNEDRMENCFVNDLEIVFYQGESEDGGKTVTMVNDAAVTVPRPAAVEQTVVTHRVTVTLQTTSRHTLAALAQLGVLEKEVPLITQAQMEQLNLQWEKNGQSWDGIDLKTYAWDILGG